MKLGAEIYQYVIRRLQHITSGFNGFKLLTFNASKVVFSIA